MKNLFFIISLIISLNSNGQFTSMFNDTLKPFGAGGYTLDGLCKTDSFYYVLGGYNNGAWNWNNFILKLDKQGHIVNKNIFDDTLYHHYPFAYNCLVINNNYLVFCEQVSNGIAKGMVTKVNRYSLDTIWTKVIAHPDTAIAIQPNSGQFSELTAIKTTPDGGYILTGNYNKNCITGNLRSFLMKIDSLGNVEWRRVYSDVTYLFDIELTSFGGYAFLNKFGNNINKIVFTDSLGVIIRQQLINSGQGGLSKTSSLTTNDGNIFYGAHTYTFDVNNHYYGLNIYKYNYSTNQVLWDKKYIPYSYIEFVSLHPALGIEVMSNGDIISSGTAKRYGYDAFILKLNSNGDSLWCKSYDFHPDPYDCQLNDLIITDDGGFMGVGFWSDQSGPGWTAWMFKTDANGVVGWESSTPLSGLEVKVWPNPAHNYTTLSLSKPLNQESKLVIYNTLGQKVKSIGLQKNISQIEISLLDFQKGIYYFEILTNNKIMSTGKILKE